MATRRPDKIEVSLDDALFDGFESLQITNGISDPTEATMTIGDDGSYEDLRDLIAPGETVTVRLNGKPRLKGRAEVNEIPVEAGGTVIQLTVRTRMADARYSSAPLGVKVENTTLKQFVLDCYAPLGYKATDFDFSPATARDMLTGKGGPAGDTFLLDAIKPDQAKVNPGDTIFDAVDRHLRRHSMSHWERADGSIVVGAPNDAQDPTFRLQSRRGPDSKGNNVLMLRRVIDWSEITAKVVVFGQTTGKDVAKSSIQGVALDTEIAAISNLNNQFTRVAVIQDQQIKNLDQANRKAQRELSMRHRRKDAWEATVDGWTYWNGSEQIPWAPDATADIHSDVHGGALGRHLIHRVRLSLSSGGAVTTQLALVAPGIWKL